MQEAPGPPPHQCAAWGLLINQAPYVTSTSASIFMGSLGPQGDCNVHGTSASPFPVPCPAPAQSIHQSGGPCGLLRMSHGQPWVRAEGCSCRGIHHLQLSLDTFTVAMS